MKKIKLLMPILGIPTLAISIAPLANCNCTPTIKVTSVTVNGGQSMELTVGVETKLTTQVLPENASDKSLTWSSSDEDKITVNKTTGVVKALVATETPVIITATAKDGSGVKGKCSVTAKSAEVESITLSATSIDSLALDGEATEKQATISATITYPSSNDKITWSINDEGQNYIDIDKTETSSEEVVTITAKKLGKAILTASCGGKTATCSVDVGYNQTVIIDGDKVYGSVEGLCSEEDDITGINIDGSGEEFQCERYDFNKKIVLGKTITTIDNEFLCDCSSFNNGENEGETTSPLYIPNNIETIGYDFMYSCSSFNQTIILNNGLKTIDTGFLINCSQFNNGDVEGGKSIPLSIPSSVESVGNDMLYIEDEEEPFFSQQITFEANSQLKNFGCFSDVVSYISQPAESSGITFTNGILYNTNTKSILGITNDFDGEIPDDCNHIGDRFGYGTSFNKQLNLPTTLRSIGDNFLNNNETFAQNISIPEGVETIGNNFLLYDEEFDGTQTITFPSTLKSIGKCFLSNSATIAGYCTHIGSLDFSAISVPDSVSIGEKFLYNNFRKSSWEIKFIFKTGTTNAWKTKILTILGQSAWPSFWHTEEKE